MEDELYNSDICSCIVSSFVICYDVDIDQVNLVFNIILILFNYCQKVWKLCYFDYCVILGWVVLLYEVGF